MLCFHVVDITIKTRLKRQNITDERVTKRR